MPDHTAQPIGEPIAIRRRVTSELGKPEDAQAWVDEHRGRKKEALDA